MKEKIEKEILRVWDAIVFEESDKGGTAWHNVRRRGAIEAAATIAEMVEEELSDWHEDYMEINQKGLQLEAQLAEMASLLREADNFIINRKPTHGGGAIVGRIRKALAAMLAETNYKLGGRIKDAEQYIGKLEAQLAETADALRVARTALEIVRTMLKENGQFDFHVALIEERLPQIKKALAASPTVLWRGEGRLLFPGGILTTIDIEGEDGGVCDLAFGTQARQAGLEHGALVTVTVTTKAE